eukprot:10231794-Alexandrium_andersonii.AAC.1
MPHVNAHSAFAASRSCARSGFKKRVEEKGMHMSAIMQTWRPPQTRCIASNLWPSTQQLGQIHP